MVSQPNYQYDLLLNLIIIGRPGIGKTSFLRSCVTELSSSHEGLGFKSLLVGNTQIKLHIRDDYILKGHFYPTLSICFQKHVYFRGAHGMFFMYDVTDEHSFLAIESLLSTSNKDNYTQRPAVLVATKCDCSPSERKVRIKQGKSLAARHGISFVETSAEQKAFNVDLAVSLLAAEVFCASPSFELTLTPKPNNPLSSKVLIFDVIAKGDKRKLVQILTEDPEALHRTLIFEISPLNFAAYLGRLSMVKILVRAGADLTHTTLLGETPLMQAARMGHRKVVRYLLKHGASPRIPLHAVVLFQQHKILKILLDAGASDVSSPLPISHAQLKIRPELNELFGIEPNLCQIGVLTPLMLAVSLRQFNTVKQLTKADVDLNAINADGETALYLAAKTGCIAIAKLLLSKGANPDLHLINLDHQVLSPIHSAAATGNVDMVRLLIHAGADATSTYRYTTFPVSPMMVAAIEGHGEVIQLLIDAGIDPITTSLGSSPISFAASHGHISIVRTLIPSASPSNLCRALFLATEGGHIEIVDELLNHGVDPNGIVEGNQSRQ